MTLDGILSSTTAGGTDIIAHPEKLEPFGRGNPTPRFLVQNVRLSAPLAASAPPGAHPPAHHFPRHARRSLHRLQNSGDIEPQLPVGTELNLVVEPKIDCFNGNTRVDPVVSDIALLRQRTLQRVATTPRSLNRQR